MLSVPDSALNYKTIKKHLQFYLKMNKCAENFIEIIVRFCPGLGARTLFVIMCCVRVRASNCICVSSHAVYMNWMVMMCTHASQGVT